jgi:hypothetical protein
VIRGINISSLNAAAHITPIHISETSEMMNTSSKAMRTQRCGAQQTILGTRHQRAQKSALKLPMETLDVA